MHSNDDKEENTGEEKDRRNRIKEEI